MKIAMVTGSYPPQPCGIGEYTRLLVRELRKKGIEIDVITTRAASPREPGSTHLEVDDWSIWNWRKAVRTLRGERYDLVHIQYPARFYGYRPDLALLGLIAKRGLPGIPIVATLHEYYVAHWLRKLTVGAIVTPLDAVILTAESEEREIQKAMPWLRGRIRVIHLANTIPTINLPTDRRDMLRKEWGVGSTEIAVVYFGFIHPNKGIDSLLKAFAQFHAQHQGARLVMLSMLEENNNAYHDHIRDEVESLGLSTAIIWKGFLSDSDVAQHLAAADIGFFPYEDGVTLRRSSFIAAMSEGLPVLSTSGHAGDRALGLVDGVNVSLVPAQSAPSEFSARLEDLASDASKRSAMGIAARLWAASFQWESVTDAFRHVYDEVLEEKRR